MMNVVTKKVNCFLFSIWLLLLAVPASAQVNRITSNSQTKTFNSSLTQLNMSFNFPEGFKEIKAPNTEEMPFDYGMELPDQDFEIWLRLNTQKDDEKFLADKNIRVANADSLYLSLAQDQINSFTTDKSYLKRSIPDHILDRYNADAGNTFLINIDDSPVTKHYKYALLIVLQKNKVGTVLAICFTNEKGPEFFKNMHLASSCLKFKD